MKPTTLNCPYQQDVSKEHCRIFKITYQPALWLDKWPVLAIHLVVETAGIAEVVAIAVPSPQRGGGGATVYTLAAF